MLRLADLLVAMVSSLLTAASNRAMVHHHHSNSMVNKLHMVVNSRATAHHRPNSMVSSRRAVLEVMEDHHLSRDTVKLHRTHRVVKAVRVDTVLLHHPHDTRRSLDICMETRELDADSMQVCFR